MLTENKPIANYVGLTSYHNSGYTGKGVKVCVIEINEDHKLQVVRALQQAAPDCDIVYIDGGAGLKDGLSNKRMQQIIDSGAQIVNMSLTRPRLTPEDSLKLIKAGVTLICSAGNEGSSGTNESSKDPNWIAVGAMTWYEGKPVLSYYSGRGVDLDVMSFTPYIPTSGTYVFMPEGTSFSAPYMAGMLACWYQYYHDKYGRYPTQPEVVDLINANCIDFGEPGFDINYGNGVLRLPTPEEKVIRLKIGSNVVYVNGKESFVDPDNSKVVPVIAEKRTMVPLRFIAETMGCKVEWLEKTKEVIISK